jgi:dephospho-CoA kinase
VPAIESAFPGTTGPDGVDRKALGAAVFGDRDRLALLESIIHPAVGDRRKAFLESHEGADMILFDIPLLFEKGGQAGVDTVVVVSAPAAVQRERVLARPNMTPDKFEHILALQMDDADKRARADHVIDTGKDIIETRADVRALVKKLRLGLA